MSKTTLHPSVKQFKQFVKKHPLLIKEVRAQKKSWQDFYEEWTILGENDEVWEKYKMPLEKREGLEEEVAATKENSNSSEKQGTQLTDLLAMLKSVNLNDIQGHIQNLSGIMSTVQGLLQSFQSNPNQSQDKSEAQSNEVTTPANSQQRQQSPFNFRQF